MQGEFFGMITIICYFWNNDINFRLDNTPNNLAKQTYERGV